MDVIEFAGALIGLAATIIAIPVWIAAGMPVTRRRKILIGVCTTVATLAWFAAIFWLAAR